MTFPSEIPDSAFLFISNNALAREYLRRIYEAQMRDREDVMLSLYREIEPDLALLMEVWAGLPNTFKQRIKQLDELDRGTTTRKDTDGARARR
jgi:hypothetical protein